MIDKKTIDRIALLHPKLREEATEIYHQIALSLTGKAMCRFSHTLRTFSEQNEIYAKGRTKPGHIVTKAAGGLSMHNYGLAVDIVLIIDEKEASWDEKTDFDGDKKSDWSEIVTIFKQYGWEWGGDWTFRDSPHFQKNYGKSVRELLALYNSKKVDKNNYVLI